MKFQPKRFVVEVKRGTNRAAFSSPDAGLDKFTNAEAMLFGTPREVEPVPSRQKVQAIGEAPRRILRSLIEPPAPEPVIEDPIERPRRGRKPGSKNKPKNLATSVAPLPSTPQLSEAALAFMAKPEPKPAPVAETALPIAADDAAPVEADQGRRSRLRDRSSILRRYVLGLEPQPGQMGSMRARRQARAAAL